MSVCGQGKRSCKKPPPRFWRVSMLSLTACIRLLEGVRRKTAAAMARWAACRGIPNKKDNTHTPFDLRKSKRRLREPSAVTLTSSTFRTSIWGRRFCRRSGTLSTGFILAGNFILAGYTIVVSVLIGDTTTAVSALMGGGSILDRTRMMICRRTGRVADFDLKLPNARQEAP